MSHFSLYATGYPCRLFELLVYPHTLPLHQPLEKKRNKRKVSLNMRRHNTSHQMTFGISDYLEALTLAAP